jgi:hypothetical protein
VRDRQAAVLRRCLLNWLPPLVEAIDVELSPAYSGLAHFTWEIAGHHEASLEEYQVGGTSAPAGLPAPLPDLAAASQNLHTVTASLTRPSHCGLLLSRQRIASVAGQFDLPSGFGDRRLLLSNLLRAAGQYELVSEVLQALSRVFAAGAANYDRMDEALPVPARWVAPWRERTLALQRQLQGLSSVVQA